MNTKFDPLFPELFDWENLDSISLSYIGKCIADDIKKDLKTESRNFVPGLRLALQEIAIREGL